MNRIEIANNAKAVEVYALATAALALSDEETGAAYLRAAMTNSGYGDDGVGAPFASELVAYPSGALKLSVMFNYRDEESGEDRADGVFWLEWTAEKGITGDF